MSKLTTIQKRNNLNEVYRAECNGVGGASHYYLVKRADSGDIVGEIRFQHGPRTAPESTHGVLDNDLLEIVRDRLVAFNKGEFATRENAIAITHIEEALLWLNKRVEDRAERGVLGTTNK